MIWFPSHWSARAGGPSTPSGRWRSLAGAVALAALCAIGAPGGAATVLEDAEALGSEQFAGRRAGSQGERDAAQWLADELRQIGVEPLPGYRDYRLSFDFADHTGRLWAGWNVIGWLPPNAEDAVTSGPGRIVLLSAHYDHLGRGRTPDSRARKEERGRIHPGADDNASGVAVALAAARRLAESERRRGVVLAFYSAEEYGGLGAEAFMKITLTDPEAVLAAVNVDMVGRLGDGDVLWTGGEDAESWRDFLAGTETAVPLEENPKDFGENDAAALREAGVPTLDLSTALHPDYHRPTDTADKLDGEGLERVAAFVTESVRRLMNDGEAFAP